MSGAIEVAALQLDAVPGDPDGNRRRLEESLRRHAAGAGLVVAPELVNVGYDLAQIDRFGHELAEAVDGPTVGIARSVAASTGSTIVVGILERARDRLYDTAVLVLPGGEVARYRKTHLYPPERSRFAAGDELLTVPTPVGKLGLMICFEHAFPEIATTLALRGAQVLAIPSAVPFGFEHLLTLRTRARAQDNQLFAVAANLAGNGFCGNSLIAGPRGEVLAAAGTGVEVLRATIDLATIERERAQEPALRLRRPSLYRDGL
jgi:predicted amidohydrolase